MGHSAVIQHEDNGAVMGKGVKTERREGHQAGNDLRIAAHGQDLFANGGGGNPHAAIGGARNTRNYSYGDNRIEVGVSKADLREPLGHQSVAGDCSNHRAKARQGRRGNNDLRIFNSLTQKLVQIPFYLREEHDTDNDASAEQGGISRESEQIEGNDNKRQGDQDQEGIGQSLCIQPDIQVLLVFRLGDKMLPFRLASFGRVIEIENIQHSRQGKTDKADDGRCQYGDSKRITGDRVVQGRKAGDHAGSYRWAKDAGGNQLAGQIGNIEQRDGNGENRKDNDECVDASCSQNDVADDHGDNDVFGAQFFKQTDCDRLAQTRDFQKLAEQRSSQKDGELGNDKASHTLHVSSAIAVNKRHSTSQRNDQCADWSQNNKVYRLDTAKNHNGDCD